MQINLINNVRTIMKSAKPRGVINNTQTDISSKLSLEETHRNIHGPEVSAACKDLQNRNTEITRSTLKKHPNLKGKNSYYCFALACEMQFVKKTDKEILTL